jgi:hypothetical protein
MTTDVMPQGTTQRTTYHHPQRVISMTGRLNRTINLLLVTLTMGTGRFYGSINRLYRGHTGRIGIAITGVVTLLARKGNGRSYKGSSQAYSNQFLFHDAILY